jgi:NAD(P)H dehydrogenase (quinone)
MIVITGASGQFGRLAIKSLLDKIPASQIIAAVRNPQRIADLTALGIQARKADYSQPDSLKDAFKGAEKVLLISSSEVGQRTVQHKNVIDAVRTAGVSLLAYTSLLHADTSPMLLAKEHVATETYLRETGVPFVLLRNSWYTENYLAGIQPALQHGAFIGCAGDGRISSAARADYAEAAAVVLTSSNQEGRVYELAGDTSYTLAEFAEELSRQTGRQIPYVHLPETGFKEALVNAGLPEPMAGLLADSDACAAKGALFDDRRQLSGLTGRPTASLASLIASALK